MASDDTVQQELEQARALFEEQMRQDETRRLEEEQHSFSEQNEYNNSTAGDTDSASGDSGDSRSHQQNEELIEDPVSVAMEQNEPLDILADAVLHPPEEEHDHSHGDHLDHADIFNAAATHQNANDYKWIKKAMVEQSGGDTSFKTSFDKKNKEDEETRAFKNFQTYMAVKSFGAQTEQIRIAAEQLQIGTEQTIEELEQTNELLEYRKDITRDAIKNDETLREIMIEQGLDLDTYYEKGIVPDEVKTEYDNSVLMSSGLLSATDEQEFLNDQEQLTQKAQGFAYQRQQVESGEISPDAVELTATEKRDIARDQFIREEFGMTEKEAGALLMNGDPRFEEILTAVTEWEAENPESSFENNTESAVTVTVTSQPEATANKTASSYASGMDKTKEDQLTSQTAFAAAADPAQPKPETEPAPESSEVDPALQQQERQPQSLGL